METPQEPTPGSPNRRWEPDEEAGARRSPSAAQWAVAGIALALGIGAVVHRLLHEGQLEQTAALFIGLPTVLAITLALTPRARSATGMAMKGTTVALFLSGIVLGEGFICILMASPLFFLVAAAIGLAVDTMRERRGRANVLVAVPIVLTLLSLEGVTPATSLPREELVEVTRTVTGSAQTVERALATPPRLGHPLPVLFRLGFPRPVAATGSGLEPGARRAVTFARHARHFQHRDGTLVLEVTRSVPGSVTFRAVSDTSPVASWLAWEEATVTWAEAGPGRAEVRWAFRYRRLLDPGWYFGPWQRYAVRLAAGYLIDAAATPGLGTARDAGP